MPARPPVYDLRRVAALRDALCEDLVLCFSQEAGTPAVLDDVAAAVRRRLPPTVSQRAVRDSLVDLVGQTLDKERLRRLAWRIAGNLPKLRRCRTAPPWLRQTAPERAPAVIVHVERLSREVGKAGERKETETGGRFTFEVQAGTPAGLRLRTWWSTRYVARHRRVFGFARMSRRPDNLPPGQPFLAYEDVRQLCGFRLSLRFTPESCRDGLGFDGFTCPPSALDHNRRLLTLRTRVSSPCPMAYAHACHLCAVGQDRCRAACHPLSYITAHCPGCDRPDAFFDPALSRGDCVECAARNPTDMRGMK